MEAFGLPQRQGLYDPRFEKGSCGIGMLADIQGRRSRDLVEMAFHVLERLSHRGAQGCDPLTGDGAGVLIQMPHEFLIQAADREGFNLPESGSYGVGTVFFPSNGFEFKQCKQILERKIHQAGAQILGWREVPVCSSALGDRARLTEPKILQVFVTGSRKESQAFARPLSLEHQLYLLRKQIENEIEMSGFSWRNQFYICSFSSKTLVYKGLLLPRQLREYFLDLQSPLLTSALVTVHSRFSTNTFPAWSLAHPYRYLCHNGEINTLKGNINWMRAREGQLHSDIFGEDLSQLFPIIRENQSDSASLDNMVEFLVMSGRSLPHAMMMLMPEPWEGHIQPDPPELNRRGFYEYHAAQMEPWDGPAAVCFTDGTVIGAALDRNGLRPCRYQITSDGRVILSSEVGVLPLNPSKIIEKGRLQPGQMFLVDTEKGQVLTDGKIKSTIANQKPYGRWVSQHLISLDQIESSPDSSKAKEILTLSLRQRQKIFDWTEEELKRVIHPMSKDGEEPTSSMGNDTPLAFLSRRPQLVFKYFRQMFAQVTNPAIDPIRERRVMSLRTQIGPSRLLLSDSFSEGSNPNRRIILKSPILSPSEFGKLLSLNDMHFKLRTLPMVFHAGQGARGLRAALVKLCREAERLARAGSKILILSDREVSFQKAPIPSLLAVSAVHQHLIRKSLRAELSLIVDSGEPRDVHHFACLLGYGAGAVYPSLVFDSLNGSDADSKYIKAIEKGLLKVFSKMGISTFQSYCGAQIFEAIGLTSRLIEKYFPGTPSRIDGVGLKEIASDAVRRHAMAAEDLEAGGEIHYRVQGEAHAWNPETISSLQIATQTGDPATYREFSRRVNNENRGSTIRGLFDLKFLETPLSLDEIEPASEIVKRFTTGAMSLGALGREAHETLALAMNRMGARSNSGEGGEDPERFLRRADGEWANSAIKQVASGRFGVTAHYLVHAREIQIKVSQGAKPGEGGQLPGHKVNLEIARLRHSTPGIQLISPPPHHDIYSIEDLAQLIFDLKNVNPAAEVSVKLVAECGVGTIAAGVAKARADKVLISGDSGGTGASPLSSIKYAGIPWEIGLAETHQTLVLNGLRDRIRIETDGQLKTGHDVVVAALLGAEEFGFSTAPLIVEGCVMMRKCHLNTCPVGIATQDVELRKKFKGSPEAVINYFFFVAEEVRGLMSRLGVHQFKDLVGQVKYLRVLPEMKHLNLSRLIARRKALDASPLFCSKGQGDSLGHVLDHDLIETCKTALEGRGPVRLDLEIQNTDRATGAMLSGRIASLHGPKGLPEDEILIRFRGSAGQSFGAFLSAGVSFFLEGECNDYVGKSLSGGKIVVVPPRASVFNPEEAVLIGNTSLYGATSGEAYFEGCGGERFAVRNSGAKAVIEGVGDHGCEYMTGGLVVVLGKTGVNFGAGMSGGVAFVLDEDGQFRARCNMTTLDIETVIGSSGPLSGANVEPKSGPDVELDSKLLRVTIESHVKYTGSRKAARILKLWDEYLPKFLKVIPREYRRIPQPSLTFTLPDVTRVEIESSIQGRESGVRVHG